MILLPPVRMSYKGLITQPGGTRFFLDLREQIAKAFVLLVFVLRFVCPDNEYDGIQQRRFELGFRERFFRVGLDGKIETGLFIVGNVDACFNLESFELFVLHGLTSFL
jgi:hypothetical protein